MQYFVILGDGRRFGPADVETINKWVLEKRVNEQTMLEEVESGRQVIAGSVPGLLFGAPPPVDPTQGFQQTDAYSIPPQPKSQYPSGDERLYDDGRNAVTWSFVSSIGSIALCCCFPVAIVGVVLGTKAKANGNPNGNAAIIVAWIALGIGLVYWIFSYNGLVTGFNQGLQRGFGN